MARLGLFSILMLCLAVNTAWAKSRFGDECLTEKSVIEELKETRAKLEKQQKEIEKKETELAARERALDEEIKRLELLRVEITGVKEEQKKKVTEQVDRLVEAMEKMSPKAAAKLITSLDDKLAVETASKISTDRLAKLMNLMDPKDASNLSRLLTFGKKRSVASQEGGKK